MDTDSFNRNPAAGANLTGGERSDLPRVLGVEAARVRFDPPRRFYLKGQLVEHREAVELLVRTASPLPILDLTPVLFIGDVPVSEYATVGDNLYRFYAYDVERLPAGALISLGWPYAPEAKIPTGFRFNPAGRPLVS